MTGTTGPARAAVGRHGEDVAVAHLVSLGWVVLDRGWRAAPGRSGLRGELDVVALDDRCLVAVEVKTRREGGPVHPLESVTATKAARLRRLVAAWLREHDVRPHEVRVDLVAVVLPRRGRARLDHLRAVA